MRVRARFMGRNDTFSVIEERPTGAPLHPEARVQWSSVLLGSEV